MLNAYFQTLQRFSRNTRLYLIVNSLTSISYVGIYVMLFNLYLLRLGHGPAFIGLINAAAQLGVAAFSIPAGMLGRRWGSRRLIIGGLTVATVGLGLVPLVEFFPSSWRTQWLLFTYIFAWLGGGTYVVNSQPFLMNATSAQERNHAFSMREALVPLSLFVGSLVGGMLPGLLVTYVGGSLADPTPYRYALFIAAALFALAPITMLLTSEATAGEEAPPLPRTALASLTKPSVRATAPIGLMAFIGLLMLLLLASKHITDTFFNVYLDVGLHLSPVWIGTLAGLAQLLAVPLALVTPLIIARWGKEWTIIGGAIGMALSLGWIILLPHWVGAGLGLLGVSALFAVMMPAFAIVSQEIVAAEWRATMSGVTAMAMGLSRSGSALGGGYLISRFGFPSLFMVGIGLTVIGALVWWGYTWFPLRYLRYRTA
jgi:predicted MFS family arabinose efflux permease